jgi:Family of unknown function (DUF5895)
MKATTDTTVAINREELKAAIETTKAAPVVTYERDMFASDEYVDTSARLPRIQALRGENGAEGCGYFIKIDDLANSGWVDFDEKDLITYEYNSGGTELGLLLKKPRMLVKQYSPMFAIDKLASKEAEKQVVIGKYEKAIHGNRELFQAAVAYEVFLLDANNKPLHEIPFAYIAKGANLGTFSTKWEECVKLITQLHARANSIPAKAKDARFKAMCVFEFTVKRELAGTAAKSPSCKVDTFTRPTMDNWSEYFLGRNKEIATNLLNILAPTGKLLLPQNLGSEVEGEEEESASDYIARIDDGHPGYGEEDAVEPIAF